MEHWHGFMTARSIAQIHETTIADVTSDISAHFVTVPARSLGGKSYRFQGSEGPFDENPALGRRDPGRHRDLRFGAEDDKSPRFRPQRTPRGAREKSLRRTPGRRRDPLIPAGLRSAKRLGDHCVSTKAARAGRLSLAEHRRSL